ncbi:MAG: DNA polymerase ligase N-terminal domain-containing protein [Candidatus Babeliales bacterium]
MVQKKNETSLKQYAKRRTVSESGEPAAQKKVTKGKQPLFVIQRHDASHLHYDFRLEIGGVLVSWAVPKGPSKNPTIKRLAVRTDNHPMAYATFEGRIAEGHYGAGTVAIWDHGTFENIKTHEGKPVSLGQCLRDGQIEVRLHGEKLQGNYVLIRFKEERGTEQWLLKKMRE